MNEKKGAGTVGVDFDGVIHAYTKGWQDGALYDDVIPGTALAFRDLMEKYAVFVFTSRQNLMEVSYYIRDKLSVPVMCAIPSSPREFWNEMGVVYVTNVKLPAIAYIDDRGIRFTSWDQTLKDLAEFTS